MWEVNINKLFRTMFFPFLLHRKEKISGFICRKNIEIIRKNIADKVIENQSIYLYFEGEYMSSI